MNFNTPFLRTVSGSGALTPADAAPTGTPAASAGNQFAYQGQDINGWPVHRIAAIYTGPQASISADLYVWEAQTQAWFKVSATPTVLTKNVIAYFPVPTIAPMAGVTGNIQKSGGLGNGMNVALVPIDPTGLANGTYTFAMAADLTSFG